MNTRESRQECMKGCAPLEGLRFVLQSLQTTIKGRSQSFLEFRPDRFCYQQEGGSCIRPIDANEIDVKGSHYDQIFSLSATFEICDMSQNVTIRNVHAC